MRPACIWPALSWGPEIDENVRRAEKKKLIFILFYLYCLILNLDTATTTTTTSCSYLRPPLVFEHGLQPRQPYHRKRAKVFSDVDREQFSPPRVRLVVELHAALPHSNPARERTETGCGTSHDPSHGITFTGNLRPLAHHLAHSWFLSMVEIFICFHHLEHDAITPPVKIPNVWRAKR